MANLENKHRRETNELMTRHTKQSFELKMRQGREVEELMERQRMEDRRRVREKTHKVNRYSSILKTGGSGGAETAVDKPDPGIDQGQQGCVDLYLYRK